jgi:hypothetical protein
LLVRLPKTEDPNTYDPLLLDGILKLSALASVTAPVVIVFAAVVVHAVTMLSPVIDAPVLTIIAFVLPVKIVPVVVSVIVFPLTKVNVPVYPVMFTLSTVTFESTVQLPDSEFAEKKAVSAVPGTDAPPVVAAELEDQFAVLLQLPVAFLTQYLLAILKLRSRCDYVPSWHRPVTVGVIYTTYINHFRITAGTCGKRNADWSVKTRTRRSPRKSNRTSRAVILYSKH